ncbi:MAG: dihydrodipicolinate reductase [Candidatus Heimdallarchaeota archaeon]
MTKPFRVIHVGLGPMGRLIAKLIIERPNLILVGAVDIAPGLVGRSLQDILAVSADPEVIVRSSLSEALEIGEIDIVVITTASALPQVAPLIQESVLAQCNVISICEELAFPYRRYPDLSRQLSELAVTKGVTITGTGINPGYLMDVLPIVLAAPCQRVDKISVTRMMNSGRRRTPFQRKIGTGLSTTEFDKKIRDHIITGHVGLEESIRLIASAMGIECDDVLEYPPEAITATSEFTTSYGELVPEGYVCGLRSRATAKYNGREFINLEFVAYAGDHEEYDAVVIEGLPRIDQKIMGGVHGDLGTAAMVANLIPRVVNAAPGIHTMKDLPIPSYTANIWR